MNLVVLIGNVGTDIDSKEFNSKIRVTFSLVTNSIVTKNGEKVKEPCWHNIVSWNGTAELISKHVKKGDKIMVRGQIKYWAIEKDGVKYQYTNIVVNEVEFIHKSKANQSLSDSPVSVPFNYIDEDDLSF